MLFNRTTYLGIDPTAGAKPITYAALDANLRLLALGQGSLEEVCAFAGGQQRCFAAINAPRQPNCGVLAQEQVRRKLNLNSSSTRWRKFRLCEYQLYQHGISVLPTPAEAAAAPNWVQTGFKLYQRLQQAGYQTYPHHEAACQSLETYPHAAFTALLGRVPFPKNTLEGRIQRQIVLYDSKLHIPDPMRIFEEITRHRIKQGVLPLDGLHTPEELDALAAAYTAWCAENTSQTVVLLGDPHEGQIALPAALP